MVAEPEYSDKSVIIRDSSDDEFSADLDLPEDILDLNSPHPETPARKGTATDSCEYPEEDSAKPPFDPELDVSQAIEIIQCKPVHARAHA
ncbi:hypothetical protein GGF46_000471 [Coemansia sp. RSA 552]|nr:hypothetical protein GGF46_000471 [Coemansia sp. RSA 552]